jgi:hypothetical protein
MLLRNILVHLGIYTRSISVINVRLRFLHRRKTLCGVFLSLLRKRDPRVRLQLLQPFGRYMCPYQCDWSCGHIIIKPSVPRVQLPGWRLPTYILCQSFEIWAEMWATALLPEPTKTNFRTRNKINLNPTAFNTVLEAGFSSTDSDKRTS